MLCAAALAMVGATLAAAAKQPGASVFPTITSEALDKSTVTLPAQLQGTYDLLLLSWARDQGPQLNTWTAVSQALEHTYTDVRVYRLPVSAPENPLFRWWDNASLRTDETDPDSLHWTVPLYTDKAKLRHALGEPADDHHILVLLVDRAGKVLWKAEGPSTAASRQALLSNAEALHAGAAQGSPGR